MGRKRLMNPTPVRIECYPPESPVQYVYPGRPDKFSPIELSREHKRAKVSNSERDYFGTSFTASLHPDHKFGKKKPLPKVIDYSDPFALHNMLGALDGGKYGSETKAIESLCARRTEILNALYAMYPSLHSSSGTILPAKCYSDLLGQISEGIDLLNCQVGYTGSQNVGDIETGTFANNSGTGNLKEGTNNALVIDLESDEEDNKNLPQKKSYSQDLELRMKQVQNNLGHCTIGGSIGNVANWKSSYLYQKVVLNNSVVGKKSMLELQVSSIPEKSTNEGKGSKQLGGETARREDANEGLSSAIALVSDVGSASVSNQSVQDDDGLGDMWREMTMALEFSKDATSDSSTVRQDREECEHSLVLKDDIGYVCRICGVIQKSIETIFDFQWAKGSKSIRTYPVESCNKNNSDQTERTQISGYAESDYELMEEVCIHPRHREQMKGHQLEGFKFLVRNLIGEKPGGCILAHAPGSGKTFMVISFIQSFLAKYPHARPLVVLPKGILSTWKKEFKTWQIEEIPLYDFYTEKADNRSQQLEVLDQWVGTKSVLLLGYKQFASIVCGVTASKVEAACQERLLKVPSLLILDEGHTPRNENTDVLHSLDKVQTPRKVVLSGTLFQNHVREVFNILNLVRPKFLRLESSRGIVRRVLSKGEIPGGNRRHLKGAVESTFFDMVENTLQHEENLKMKVAVIKDLREMTRDVLHYYKGDFLEDLPGLVDFTVVLNLTEKQKASIQKSKKLDKFKRSSVNSGICMHPHLDELLKNASGECIDEDKIDRMIESSNINDGIKTKFFLNILGLAESAGEKVIVFSRYILPLKFLERVLIRLKGWRSGKEMFVISGDSNQENRELSMDKFNNSADAKVFFGSIKACGEGISLVGGSRILILDVHLNPSVTRQAIGRAYRPGQKKKVYTYRLVAAESPEEEDHITSFRKELISKMWFEWSEFCGTQGFDMEKVDLRNCEDDFLESSSFSEEDVKALYRR